MASKITNTRRKDFAKKIETKLNFEIIPSFPTEKCSSYAAVGTNYCKAMYE